jgi:hypothetical protein
MGRTWRTAPIFAVAASGAALLACHSPGPYGHASKYAPTSEEERAVEGARPYDPVMARRAPADWRGKDLTLFGVVVGRTPGPQGRTGFIVGVRRLAARNLCRYATVEDSCRVTVTDAEFGSVKVYVALTPEDETSEKEVRPGSLLRIVGRLDDAVDADMGGAALRASFYRHWPPGAYVTTKASEELRQ